MAIDGVKLDVPDTAANLAWLGRPGGLTRRPFPQVQVLGLGECGTHAVVAAQIGTLGVGERELAAGLLEAMGPGMLVIADRGFFSFEFWRDCLLTGADLLFRVPSGLKLPVLQALPDGSYLSEIASPKVPGGATRRRRWHRHHLRAGHHRRDRCRYDRVPRRRPPGLLGEMVTPGPPVRRQAQGQQRHRPRQPLPRRRPRRGRQRRRPHAVLPGREIPAAGQAGAQEESPGRHRQIHPHHRPRPAIRPRSQLHRPRRGLLRAAHGRQARNHVKSLEPATK